MISIRSPFEKLADCCHLARITDKIRLHLSGALPEDYQMPLFHPRGLDGFFMDHFGLAKEELLEMVSASDRDDAKVAAWFDRRIGHDLQKKKSWNELSVNLGKPGQPMNQTLEWARKKYNSKCNDASIDSTFKLIDWDEGRISG